jgi:hypothetical protein
MVSKADTEESKRSRAKAMEIFKMQTFRGIKIQVTVAGFDTSGIGPSADIGLFQIKFTAVGRGTTTVGVTVNTMVDAQSNEFGTLSGTGGTITVD